MNPILVVEDEQPIRELICLVLEPLGRPVQTAADGLTAWWYAPHSDRLRKMLERV